MAPPSTGSQHAKPWRARAVFATKAFVNVAFVATLVLGGLRLHRRALADPGQAVDLGRWQVHERPAWTTLDDVQRLRAATGLTDAAVSILDDRPFALLGESLASSPAVSRVLAMRRERPNTIEVFLEMRPPVAWCEIPIPAVPAVGEERVPDAPMVAERVYQPVGADGCALGPAVDSLPNEHARSCPLIVGAAGGPARPGDPLGADVIAAADLAVSLADLARDRSLGPPSSLAARIDVSNHGGRRDRLASEIVLRPGLATGRCLIDWGRIGDSSLGIGEPRFAQKADHLLRALELFPGLEGLQRVRVAFGDLYVVPGDPDPDARDEAPLDEAP